LFACCVQEAEESALKVTQNLETHKEEKIRVEDQRQDYVKEKARLELKVKDLQDNDRSSKSEEQAIRRQLADLEKEINQKQAELQDVTPKYAQKLKKESELNTRLKALTERRDALFSKQGLNTRFKSAAERDAHITKELASIKKTTDDYVTQASIYLSLLLSFLDAFFVLFLGL